MELTPRKQEILKEVILSFITTGEPVGSKAVMEKMKKSVSSATIRNEMNDLEKMGLLEQPHTSAGRVPTARGYRIYVDTLMEEYRLSFEETLLLNSLLAETLRDADRVLEEMASLLTRLTGYTAVLFARERVGTIERFDAVYISARSFLLVMITSSGRAITKQMHTDTPLNPESVSFILSVVNDHLAKKELGGITLERLAAMEGDLGDYRVLMAPILRIIYEVMAQMGKVNVQVKGASHLLEYPEFHSEGNAAAVMRELENREELISRLREESLSGLRVHIGTSGEGLASASYVACPFHPGKGLEGAIFILGPQRMNYAKVMARLAYLAKQIHAAHGMEPGLPLIETKEK